MESSIPAVESIISNQLLVCKPREYRAIAPHPTISTINGSFTPTQLISTSSGSELTNVRHIAIKPSSGIGVINSASCSAGISKPISIEETIDAVVLNAVNGPNDVSSSCNIPLPVTIARSPTTPVKKSLIHNSTYKSSKLNSTNIILTDLNPEWIKIDKDKKANVIVNGNKIAHSLGPLKLINLEEVKLNDVVINRLCHGPVILEPVPDKSYTMLSKEGYLSNSLEFQAIRSTKNKLLVDPSSYPDSSVLNCERMPKIRRGRVKKKMKYKRIRNEINLKNNKKLNVKMETSDLSENTLEVTDDKNHFISSNVIEEMNDGNYEHELPTIDITVDNDVSES